MIHLIHRKQILAKLLGFIDSAFGTPAPEKVTLVEVGSLNDYNQIHIANAIHLPLERITQGARPWLPHLAAQIIVYSNTDKKEVSRLAVESLSRQGYVNLFHYIEGKDDWISAGLWTSGIFYEELEELKKAKAA